MTALYPRYRELKQQYPDKDVRDLAAMMAISEAELIAARVGHQVQPLRPAMAELLHALADVGEICCRTRNAYAQHEQRGCFSNVQIGEHAGIVLNPRALDLRLFVREWASVFHLHEMTAHGECRSLQFFDHYGDAVLKVCTTDNSDMNAWQQLLTDFHAETAPAFSVKRVPAPASPVECDAERLEEEWRAMTDVHQFFRLLKKYNVTRLQAFRAVSRDLAEQVNNTSLSALLERVHRQGNEIMIFVGNRACTQIFTGKIETLTAGYPWLNIVSPAFSLRLLQEGIAESWITRKPTADGIVTSLELFAADGTQIAQLYGQRSEGQPEQKRWREQLATVSAEDAAV